MLLLRVSARWSSCLYYAKTHKRTCVKETPLEKLVCMYTHRIENDGSKCWWLENSDTASSPGPFPAFDVTRWPAWGYTSVTMSSKMWTETVCTLNFHYRLWATKSSPLDVQWWWLKIYTTTSHKALPLHNWNMLGHMCIHTNTPVIVIWENPWWCESIKLLCL